VLQSQRQAAEAELNNLRTKEQQDQNRNWQSHVQKAAQTFKDSIPAWKDEQLGRKELGELVQYAKSVGYTDQEIQGAADPRALKALYDSMKLQALQQGANNLRPTKGKTLAAGSPQRPANQSKRSDAMKRLRSSGSVDDAATILATMLE
jgi:hypothetical protein